MKHLRKFNESDNYNNLTNIINECKDILIELEHDGVKYNVYGFEGGTPSYNRIKIEIGDESKIIKLHGYELMFEHLFSYLESEKFVLDRNDSFYEKDGWEHYEACPECQSTNVSSINRDDDSYFSRDEGNNEFECGKCKHIGSQEDFQTPEYPISKGELMYSIKNNYYIDFMLLSFHHK
jgi:hypothetical protein